jgi:hypothetical protein
MSVLDTIRELNRIPRFEDERDALRARLVMGTAQIFFVAALTALGITLLVRLDSALVWAVAASSAALMFICLLLLRRGRLQLAGSLLLADIGTMTLALMVHADGIYDVVFYTVPLQLFAASLILTRRGFRVFTVIALAAIAAVGGMHLTGAISNPVVDAHRLNLILDLPLVLVFTLAAAAVCHAFTGQLLALLDRTRLGEQRLREANERMDRLVTERTAALEHTSRELDTFVYSISHDLRTPLRAISGYARILLEDHHDTLGQEESALIARMEGAALRLSHMTDALLDYSRLNGKPLEAFPVNMRRLMEGLRDELSPEPGKRGVEWRIGELPDCNADLVLIRQAFKQLLGNALKFTARTADALIEVSAARDGEQIVYTVRDNGAGFDMQYADKLFKVFQRLHGVQEFTGMGVGLATAHRIVARHGGRLWAEGAQGSGASFHVALPAG